MDRKTAEFIEEFAGTARRQFGAEGICPDMESVAEAAGGAVVKTDGMRSGYEIAKETDGSFLIKVPAAGDKRNARFASAQALGHLLMHLGAATDEKRWNSWDGEEQRGAEIECRAVRFAHAFLMPEDGFRAEADRHTEEENGKRMVNLRKTAEAFGVTTSIAAARARMLGLIRSPY